MQDEPTTIQHQVPATEVDHPATSLIELPALAALAGIGRVFVKCESERPLGNFKMLGGMLAAERALARATVAAAQARPGRSRRLPRLLCASSGNHGLAVAAAARRAGADCSVYLPVGTDPLRVAHVQAMGGKIVRVRGTYDDAVQAAAEAAERGDGLLIADTSTDPDSIVVQDVMEGYGRMTREIRAQLRDIGHNPSHLFVQAGVGGLAAAMARGLRDILRQPARLMTVEPEAAACVALALQQGRPARVPGNLHTIAGMLACGIASAAALGILQTCDASPVLVCEEELAAAVTTLRATGGPETTAAGAAGVAGLLRIAASERLRALHRLDRGSSVLLVASEGALKSIGAPGDRRTSWRRLRFYW